MKNIYRNILASLFLLLFAEMSAKAQDAKINWYSMDEAQQLARKNGKKVLVYAEASWCPYCKRMEQEVLSKADIQNTMREYFYPVRIDIESSRQLTYNGRQMTQQEFSRKMRLSGTPTFFFINSEGSVLGAQPGFIPKDIYKSLLTCIGKNLQNQMKFKEYLNQ